MAAGTQQGPEAVRSSPWASFQQQLVGLLISQPALQPQQQQQQQQQQEQGQVPLG